MIRQGIVGAASLALGVALAQIPASAGGVLKVPVPDWTGGAVTCEIVHHMLENEMGYKVKRITMPAGTALDEGMRSGDLDFGCERWPGYDPVKEKYVAEYGGDGSIVYYAPTGIVGVSGYYVPRYLVEGPDAKAPDLKTWEDLNTYKDLFVTLESDGKGRLIGCPTAAWECMDAERVKGLGLDFVVAELGSETAHWAELEAAYKRKEPFIAYAWEPHWIHAALDLVEIKLPDYSESAWPVSDWPEDITQHYGPKELAERHPDIVELFKNVRITNAEQAPMILAVDKGGRDLDEVVDEWMAANETKWKAWLPQSN
ncbi:MAG: glycine betaine ABC transporter substrate-binding protein [Pseudomonadota bacterium]